MQRYVVETTFGMVSIDESIQLILHLLILSVKFEQRPFGFIIFCLYSSVVDIL